MYVALTRAKNRLIITGKVSDADKKLQKCAALAYGIDAYSIANSDNYLDWILMCTANEKSDSFSITSIDNLPFVSSANSAKSSPADVSLANFPIPTDLLVALTSRANNNLLTSTSIPQKAMAGELSPSYLDEIINNQHSPSVKAADDVSDEPANSLVLPKFITGSGTYTAAERGTAMHTFMQFMNIQNLSANGINFEIARMIEHKIISSKLAELIDKRQILIFMHSELYKRMSSASFIKREFRFNINLPAADFTENVELRAELVEQGRFYYCSRRY